MSAFIPASEKCITRSPILASACRNASTEEGEKFIHIGGPLSMNYAESNTYTISRDIMYAFDLVSDWINGRRGGVNVAGENYRVKLTHCEDFASAQNVSAIVDSLTQHIDFLLGPYTSTLTKVAVNVSERSGVVLASSGAASTEVFRNTSFAFTLLIPASKYMLGVLDLWSKGTAVLSQEMLTNGSVTVGYFSGGMRLVVISLARSRTLFLLARTLTRSFRLFLLFPPIIGQSFQNSVCSELHRHIPERPGLVISPININSNGEASAIVMNDRSDAAIADLVEQMKAHHVDLLLGCVHYDTCVKIVKQTRVSDYSPLGMAFTTCVDSSGYPEDLGSDGDYVLSPVLWHRTREGEGAVTGLSSSDFHSIFRDT